MTFKRVSRELKINRDTARLLSQATYHQVVLALRELVANAHDGNAAHIRLNIGLQEPEGGTLKVVDDGDGMSQEEFDNEFLNLGRTSKSLLPSGEVRRNRFGRPILGQFGIGFISAIPFSKEVLVETKRRDDDSVFGVRIDCGAILTGTAPGEENSFTFPGWTRSPQPEDPDKFTRIEMIGLNRTAYESIDASILGGWYETRQRRSVPISSKRRKDYLKHWLSRILPLAYEDATTDSELSGALKALLPTDYIPALISVDGQRLRRELPEPRLIDKFDLAGTNGHWRARGVLWSPQQAIEPVYARGIAVRVGDMSIGEPAYLGLNQMGRVYGKLQHITGEVQVTGLEPDLQLDRQWFYPTPATDEFLDAVRRRITELESRLQKKATVMQRFRTLKKDVDAVSTRAPSKARVAPILKVPDRLQKLTEEARAVGIRLRMVEGDSLVVPKGERHLTIGTRYGAQLLKVRTSARVVTFEVSDKGAPMTTERLVDCLLASEGPRVTLDGPHVLISTDDAAIANLRLLAVLREAVAQKTLQRSQVEKILEELTEAYR